MKKSLSVLIMFLAGLLQAGAQQQPAMRDVFSQMPDSLFPYMSHNNRLDLIDFAESGMEAEITNSFDERVRLSKLTSDYLKLELSKFSSVEMRLLPSEDLLPDTTQTVICLIRSFGEKTPFSSIKFYTAKWLPLQIEDPIVTNSDRLIAKPDTMGVELFEDLRKYLIPLCVSAGLSDVGNVITMKVSPQSTIPIDNKSECINHIIKQISIEWDGKTFK